MKRLLSAVFLLLTGIIYVFNGFQFPEDFLEFRAPDGSRDRMSLSSKDLRSDESLAVISQLGVSLSTDKRTCNEMAINPTRLSRQLESELELRSIIDSLLMGTKPRQLTAAQKKIIEKIPICEPYLDELKIISKLVSGYELIQRSVTMN